MEYQCQIETLIFIMMMKSHLFFPLQELLLSNTHYSALLNITWTVWSFFCFMFLYSTVLIYSFYKNMIIFDFHILRTNYLVSIRIIDESYFTHEKDTRYGRKV